MAVISQYFLKSVELNELFEVIKCDESCAPMDIWRKDQSNFAVWTKENKPIQNDFFNIIHEKIKQADFFVFQHLENTIPELTTEFLCKISNSKNICIPNFRLFIYCNDIKALTPYLIYAQTKVNNPKSAKELANFLMESDDSNLISILEKDYPISTVHQRYRNENAQRTEEESKIYPLYINMEKFIKDNYETKILALQHNHMNRDYYLCLLKNVLELLNVCDHNIDQNCIRVPGEGQKTVDPLDFKFFRKCFTNLNIRKPEKTHKIETLIEREFFAKK